MGSKKPQNDLSRRERQIMDTLYRRGRATAAEIREGLTDPPSYTAVRTHLTLLHEKGLVKFESDGTRYIYEPVVPLQVMAKNVLGGVLDTFFGGSVESIVATLIDREEARLTPEELDRLAKIIEQAKKEGR